MTILIDELKRQDETTLLELLEITSEEIVDRFMDKVDERLDFLINELIEEEDCE